MVVAANEAPVSAVGAHEPAPAVDRPLAQLLFNLGTIPSVERLAFQTDGYQSELLVLMRPWSFEDEERICRLQYEYLRAGGRGDLEIRVYGLDHLDPEALPELETVIERQHD